MNESPFDVTETPVAAKTPPTEAPPADVLPAETSLMVQLSIINPQQNLPTFARFKFFYAKCPFIGDFSRDFFKELLTHPLLSCVG